MIYELESIRRLWKAMKALNALYAKYANVLVENVNSS